MRIKILFCLLLYPGTQNKQQLANRIYPVYVYVYERATNKRGYRNVLNSKKENTYIKKIPQMTQQSISDRKYIFQK